MQESSENPIAPVKTEEFHGKAPESPKALSFTVDFGDGKPLDTERHKVLVEKFQRKHRRGQSLSKLDDSQGSAATSRKPPLTGNLPRKSSFQSEGYFSSDERNEAKVNKTPNRHELTLPLKNINGTLPLKHNGAPPLKNNNVSVKASKLASISSPDSDLISPFDSVNRTMLRQFSNPETCTPTGNLIDLDDKTDDVSEAGTYTLDDTNYSEEQKVRMSIDREFKIEEVSGMRKTEDYLESLQEFRRNQLAQPVELSPSVKSVTPKMTKLLSPILSPTQNMSITENCVKILFPSAQSKIGTGITNYQDQGTVISVTSSGAFRTKSDKEQQNMRKLSLTKSEVHVEAYIDGQLAVQKPNKQLTASVVNVQNIPATHDRLPPIQGGVTSPTKIPSPMQTLSRPRSRNSLSSLIDLSDSSMETESYLKPTQNFINSLQKKLTLDNECDYNEAEQLNNSPKNLLKQRAQHTRHNSLDDNTMKIANKLEHFQNKPSIDQTYSNVLNNPYAKYTVQKIQNSPNNSPIRRSSSFSTKHNNVTGTGVRNTKSERPQSYNTAIQRSSSTATIKPTVIQRKIAEDQHRKIDRDQYGETESSSEEDFHKKLMKKKDLSNLTTTRALTTTRYNRAFSLRRARLDEPLAAPAPPTNAAAALPRCPNTPEMRRKFQPDHVRTEHQRAISMDRKPVKTNEVQSRYLMNVALKKPMSAAAANTGPGAALGQGRDLGRNSAKYGNGTVAAATTPVKVGGGAAGSSKSQPFSRVDSGRFSMKGGLNAGLVRPAKKDDKKSGGRSNSSLSCREKEFQNWKRRKSYDPMKAAAEGKRKDLAAKKQTNVMTQSYNEANYQNNNHIHHPDCDSSPSHSSSVHRSQSFHGTAALIQLLSSEEEDDLTLSADEGFSPPTPSPCTVSPSATKVTTTMPNIWREHVLY